MPALQLLRHILHDLSRGDVFLNANNGLIIICHGMKREEEVERVLLLLARCLLAMHLVEVVLLRDDVQDLGRVFAVVGGVPLADVLNPEQMSQ